MFAHQSIETLDERLGASEGVERAELLLRKAWELGGREADRAEALAREALTLARKHDAGVLAARALALIGRSQGLLRDFDGALESAEAARQTLAGEDDPNCLCQIQTVIGEVRYHRRDLIAAARELQKGLDVLDLGTEGALELRASALNNLGRVHFELCEYPRALEYFVETLSYARTLEDSRREGVVRTNIGNVLSEVGDLEGSLEAYRKSLAIHRAARDSYGIALTLGNLAEVLRKLGDHKKALQLCNEVLELCTNVMVSDVQAATLLLKSRALAALGQHEEAREAATVCLELEREVRNPGGEAEALSCLGDLAALRGAEAEAFALYQQSLSLPEAGQDRAVEIASRLGIARTQLIGNRTDEAIEELGRLLELVEEIGDKRSLVEVLRSLSEGHEAAGDHVAALAAFRRLRRVERALFREENANRLGALRVVHELEQSQHRERVLREMRDELETAVAERTRALQSSNEELETALAQRDRTETERARLEEQLRHAQKMEAVGRMAGGMAHDFNNLLTVIRGYGELLLEQAGPEGRATEAAVQVLSAAERAARLTSQLLAFSRKRPVRPEVLDVEQMISGLDTMLRRLLGEDITLEIKHGQDVGAVEIDPSQMEQVLVNLVVNAADAMAEGGTLSIETLARRIQGGEELVSGEYTVVRVTDTGCGMDTETERLIFDPFFTTKEPGKGTGLGLSTAYGIVRQCGGAIRVTSAPGQGSSFDVLLPTTPSLPKTAEPAREAPKTQTGATLTILLVEDEDSVRAMVREALERWDYHVLEAEDGQRALEIVGEEVQIDLILSDVVMPNLHGPALMDSVRKLRPGMRFLFTSGYPAGFEALPSEWNEEFRFLQKPFTMSELRRSIQELVTHSAPS